MPARSAPRDPVPFEPAPLDAQLAGLLRATGAEAARVVDGSRAMVLAEAGRPTGDDVAALVQLARGAGVVAASGGEDLDDLVVSCGSTVHVLRECAQLPGVVLHVRLDGERGDIGAARRALAAPALVRAVRAVLAGQVPGAAAASVAVPGQRSAPWPFVTQLPVTQLPVTQLPVTQLPVSLLPGSAPPEPRTPEPRRYEPAPEPLPLPRRAPEAGGTERQPALVTLTGEHQIVRTGALAVLALPPMPAQVQPEIEPEPPAEPAGSLFSLFESSTDDGLATGPLLTIPALVSADGLPRRRPSSLPEPRAETVRAAPPAVLQQSWADDLTTMRRLVDGLRQLA